jgi:alpha-glucosidase
MLSISSFSSSIREVGQISIPNRVQWLTEADHRLHILIEDRDEDRYRVPPEIFTAPESTPPYHESLLEFRILDHRNFSFQVLRRDNREILFDTSDTSLIFARQFLRLRTSLPKDPNLYGLGEHSDPFRLRTKDYTRTLWNRDAGAVPEGENLYGSHPIYFEHRTTGTHGVLLMNSNGLDVKIDQDERSDDRQYLEYRAIGGVIDLYFFAGPEPADVARQYAQLISKPAMVPYWSLGVR